MNGIFSAYPKLITRFLPFQVMRSWCGHSRERTCSTGAISGMCVWLLQDIRKLQAEKCYEINNFVQDCSISASMYFLLCDNHLYVKIDLAQPNFRPNLIFSCDQAALQMVFSVRPSVCLSVCLSVHLSVTPFSPCSHHRIIMKFSGVITMVKSDVHAKGQGQRSKVKVTEVNTQISGFRTLTPVWIHIWQWNHARSWKQHRRGALLFFKVIRQISRSQGSKNGRIWPKLGVSGL